MLSGTTRYFAGTGIGAMASLPLPPCIRFGPRLSAPLARMTMAPMPIPAKYRVAPEGTPAGQPYNVAQAYARSADALRGGRPFEVDFDLAVQRHKLIDAIERSSATGRSVTLA